MSRLLVCPPEYYKIDYEINPWMDRRRGADPARAREQWDRLMETLEDAGAELERIPPEPGLPDMVFTANAGVVHKGTAVPSRFRHPERQGEEAFFETWFRDQGFDVHTLEPGLFFEGAGDLLGVPELWLGGYRQRSDVRAYTQLSDVFQREIIPVELVDSRWYHLDTCFCPLSRGDVLYYPPAFDSYARSVIEERLPPDRRLAVSEPDALRFACNAVSIGDNVVLPAGCEETAALLKGRGYVPLPVPLDEFMKAGGSAKCLTLALS
jgi:N-dimethylarginine dimethylaminohydrolase